MKFADASKVYRKSGVRCGDVGHPSDSLYPPNEQTKSVVPHLRRSTACLWTQPFRAGLISGPLGLDCKHRFPMFIPPLTCPRQVGRSVRHAVLSR
jgi:hypothetical protein